MVSYVRVETLSGFANGVFLILISIFIVFEAIQRLIDPPEMNTNQLLTVSVLGLAVNLVGMFATGHHHHGHSVSSLCQFNATTEASELRYRIHSTDMMITAMIMGTLMVGFSLC